jgi:hypothetical protein
MKEEASDCTVWRTGSGRGCETVVRETAEWMNECMNKWMNEWMVLRNFCHLGKTVMNNFSHDRRKFVVRENPKLLPL